MANSLLVNYIKLSPNHNAPRIHPITKITLHHMAGNLSVETCGNVFAPSSAGASSNYGVGSDGRIGMYVEEKNRAWTSSNGDNDHRAVTIEVANDGKGPDWHVSDKAIEATINLCVDICKRNGIKSLNYTGTTAGNLTRHNMFTATICPGPYLQSKFPYISAQVNAKLGTVPAPKPPQFQEYLAKCVTIPANIRTGPGNTYTLVSQITSKGTYTIVEEKPGPGSASGWGRLKSGVGWVPLILFKKA